ncbi:MAG: glycosyltransferase family 4 protein [Candidatus Magnetoovum sp. WYHC-5]|nr:glycosyltransferase family 4 protein [Candidatus Magnetoovum sp. WYHC-5]
MKIAFIRKRFDPFGGAENYLNSLIKDLINENHDIYLISGNWPNLPNIKHIKVSTGGGFNRQVETAIKAINPQCSISFERTLTQDIYRAGDGCHRSWLQLRSRYLEKGWKSFFFKINPKHLRILKTEQHIFTETPVIVANSDMVKTQIIEHYAIPSHKIHVVYNGVDTTRFTPVNKSLYKDEIRKGLDLDSKQPVILFLGSGYQRKGLKTLLKAMTYIDKSVVAIVAGKGDIDKYKRYAAKLGLSNRIVFAGAVQQSEKFYAACDLFVLPTIYDPFSNATLEAMSSALPVITSRYNGASEIITSGQEGEVLQEVIDYHELAQKITKILANKSQMSIAARKKAESYTLSKSSKILLHIIYNGV